MGRKVRKPVICAVIGDLSPLFRQGVGGLPRVKEVEGIKMVKKEWRFKHIIKGKWATIVVESNHFRLGGIIQNAYDNAVKELNKIEKEE